VAPVSAFFPYLSDVGGRVYEHQIGTLYVQISISITASKHLRWFASKFVSIN